MSKLTKEVNDNLLRAAAHQQSLIPQNTIEVGNFEVAGRTSAAKILNGDFWNCFPISRRGVMGVVMGDITGHGPEAAMYHHLMLHLFREKSDLAHTTEEVMNLVEDSLQRLITLDRMPLTAILMEISPLDMTVNIVRSGQTIPIKVDVDGNYSKIRSASSLSLNSGFVDEMYSETITDPKRLSMDTTLVNILEGETVVSYTDGLTDMLNRRRRPLGEEKVMKAIGNFVIDRKGVYRAEEMCEMLMDLGTQHRGRRSQYDDVTVVAIRNSLV